MNTIELSDNCPKGRVRNGMASASHVACSACSKPAKTALWGFLVFYGGF